MGVNNLSSVYFDIHWPEDRPFQVIGQGMDAVDWICVLPDYPKYASRVEIAEIHKLAGGPCATATALCARYGLKVRFIGRLGDDDSGRFSLADLEKEPMDLSCLQIVRGAETQLGIILVDAATGERTVLWKRDSRLVYQKGELKRECIVAGQLLHLDGQDQTASIQAARWARGSRHAGLPGHRRPTAGRRGATPVDVLLDPKPGIRSEVHGKRLETRTTGAG